jgi:hypothetical protein
MRGEVRKPREFPRVSVRAAAADGDVMLVFCGISVSDWLRF